MKKVIWAIIGGLGTMVMLFIFIAAIGAGNNRISEDMTVEEILLKQAEAANDMKGDKVASNVIVNGATVKDGTRLTYYYTITNVEPGGYNPSAFVDISDKLKREACRERATKKAVNGGAEVNYTYRAKSGVQLFTITVNKGVCSLYH